ncbi:VWA domain-containing protein [Streptomyces sp. NPDC058471]|uniref:VWA domain-containing protein n=1 Tax=Streptomyces sp. NPDC058471 TaxID=3346516 RepID=UPI0036524B1C
MDRSLSMEHYFANGSVQRLSDQILSPSAHLDDDGKVPVGFFSTGMHSIARGGLFRRRQVFVDVELGAHQHHHPHTPAKARILHARIHDRRLWRGVPPLRGLCADLR